MMQPDYNIASAYIDALTFGCADQIIDWRFLHDADKSRPGIKRRGTLADIWQEACQWNASGYGIFACINAMDGIGAELSNVAYIRAHIVDLDNLSAPQNYQNATQWTLPPSFAVQSSPNKFHVYWRVNPYVSNQFYELQQRKLRQLFDGDRAVIDPTRVLRVPGFYHMKQPQIPHLVTCWALGAFGHLYGAEMLANALAHVNVIDGGSGARHELGNPEMAAPALDWCRFALTSTDPNSLSRIEWISFTAAWKQAAWTLADPDTLFAMWSDWCGRYAQNDPAENLKQWNSIRNTEIGWNYILNRNNGLKAYFSFGGVQRTVPQQESQPGQPDAPSLPPINLPTALDCSGEILTEQECAEWFKGCTYVERFGEILTPSGRFMSPTKFNAKYGGKKFLIDSTGKVTDEAWKAATRSTLYTVPQVDHIRFLPHEPYNAIVEDELQRKGINMFRPAVIRSQPGDISLFLRHIELMLPVDTDRNILYTYLAHNAKFPGHKIPWAPLIQSAEGVGKGVLKELIEHFIGSAYFYSPSARELIESGSKFNAWMRSRLFILVDEIRVDERRDMVETLKPMISEKRIEIQGKGQDQEVEDNYSNWAFFSNHKNAIPVDENGRRFAVFYSAIQSKADLIARNMDDAYFDRLYSWLRNGGAEYVTHWLLSWPIERGGLPMRAPATSSTQEAHRVNRTPQEQAMLNAISDGAQGFRGGWIGSVAAGKRFKAIGIKAPSDQSLTQILERLGYYHVGRAPRAYFADDNIMRSELYSTNARADVAEYGRAQGYE